MIINRIFLLAALLILLTILSACHPTYTKEQTEYYARTIGITNQFDIQRRNSRIIAVASRLCVTSEPQKEVDVQSLSKVVASGLSPFFDQVNVAKNTSSIGSAVEIARKNRADFAVFINLLDSAVLIKENLPSQLSDYHRLRVQLIVIDANSGEVIDKIQLLAKSSNFSLMGKNMNALLSKPMEQIGRDLSGV